MALSVRLRWRSTLAGITLALVLVTLALIVVLRSDWADLRVRREIINILEARFDAVVDIDQVSLSLFPRLAVEGRGLYLKQAGDDRRLPFISAQRFHASGSLLHLLRRSIDLVVLEGLEVRVAKGARRKRPWTDRFPDLTIAEIQVDGGLLLILPNNPAKLPLRFDLERVRFLDFSFEHAGRYEARITNPKPAGIIASSGSFGPWNSLDPRSTQLSGTYEFSQAKLSTIKGLGGTLSSVGHFGGILEQISVTGTTSTPDFQLTIAGQPINLETRFTAIVDGTSGDTFLNAVEATLGRSHVTASGSIAGAPGASGRTVSLEVKADGSFEDFLRLSVRAARPPMLGSIHLSTKLVLPPGNVDVSERVSLQGSFAIRDGRFNARAVQGKVDELSRRGRGEPESDRANVLSAFDGSFAVAQGRLRLPRFRFRVEGARVELSGRYRLRGGELDFTGWLLLDAPVSKTTTGFKSILLKVVDPILRKHGAGTALPVSVTGTVNEPSFSVDIRKAFWPG